MKCVICGHEFNEGDFGYVRGAIKGEVIELLPAGPKPTGQLLNYENILICLSHFEAIPENIATNLRTNALSRKDRTR